MAYTEGPKTTGSSNDEPTNDLWIWAPICLPFWQENQPEITFQGAAGEISAKMAGNAD